MPPLPSPLRAALGLAAVVVDEAKHLPDRAIELPLLAVSRALQFSLHAQQHYTALAARGEELLSGRRITDAPPTWATFDAPVEDPEDASIEDADDAAAGVSGSLAGTSGDASSTLDGPGGGAGSAVLGEGAGKTVRAPRNGRPSPFDTVGDDD